jgi:hypothetical protein
MSREFPMISEFRTDSPRCPEGKNGCAVATTEALIRRYLLHEPIPRQVDLGESMGRRHRQMDRASTHGICPTAWCPYCSYLELKARHIPVGYGRLTIDQLRSHLRRRHAVHLGGTYHPIRLVKTSSYNDHVPARGRSDNTDEGKFGHSIVVWQVGQARPDGVPLTYIVSDPDFGSSARPVIPPFCEYDAQQVEKMYLQGGFRIAYCQDAPPALDAPKLVPPPGVTLQFGGEPRARGSYVATVADARQRSSPFIRATNVIRSVPEGTVFHVSQTTLTGTNVHGSSTWHGDATGTVWMHHSVVRPRG